MASEDWVTLQDPTTGRTYFANKATGQTSWEKPAELAQAQVWDVAYDASSQRHYYINKLTRETTWNRPADFVEPASHTDWEVLTDPSTSREYYRNKVTNVTTWDKPACLSTGTSPAVSPSLAPAVSTPSPVLQPTLSSPTLERNMSPMAPSLPSRPRTMTPGETVAGLPGTGRALSGDYRNIAAQAMAASHPAGLGSFHTHSQSFDGSFDRRTIANPSPNAHPPAHAHGHGSVSEHRDKNFVPNPEKPRLPPDLMGDLHQFKMKDFAKQHWSRHKKGLFKRAVEIDDMLVFSKDPIPQGLLKQNKSNPDAVKLFRFMMAYMGDLPHSKMTPLECGVATVKKGVEAEQMRDEIFCQLCKQTNENPKKESLYRGWHLLAICCRYFGASSHFQKHLVGYIQSVTHSHDPKLAALALYAEANVAALHKAGSPPHPITEDDLERSMLCFVQGHVFKMRLDDLMMAQRARAPQLVVPQVMSVLCHNILHFGGADYEGIFRKPADSEDLKFLIKEFNQGNYEPTLKDPNSYAGALKLWVRDLFDPIFPAELYNECIMSAKDAVSAIRVTEKLPPLQKAVLHHLCEFLKKISEKSSVNKMTPENLSIVFAPDLIRHPTNIDPMAALKNADTEKQFTCHIIKNF